MARPRSPLNALFILTAIAAAAAARADDAGCKPVQASLSKYIDTPSHTYSEGTQGAQGPVQKTETIFTGTERFLLTPRGWRVNRMTSEDLKAQTQASLGAAHCQHVRDEMVGAESTAVYAFQVKNELADSDGQLWISKRSGLPVKQEQTIHVGDTPADARHVAERMSYDDVKAPPVAH